MSGATLNELKAKIDAAWTTLTRQLQGMEPHMERSDAPGEWTTRQVLAHLLSEPGSNPVENLKRFSTKEPALVEVNPGRVSLGPEREKMTLRQFLDALDARRRNVVGYLETLSETDLTQRKARIPLFKQVMGTDEVPLHVYVGLLFDRHWNDHVGQLAKIRKAVGLSEPK